MSMLKMKKFLAAVTAVCMLLAALPVMAETVEDPAVTEQKLDAAYTLALNAINKEDYATARKYLNISFVYCDPQTNPVMYADLLLKGACIDVIEENSDIALMELDAALRLQPDLADAYLVRTQIYTDSGDFTRAVENLEKYIELTQDNTLLETVAQLYEANGDMASAQSAYDRYAETAGAENQEAGFQAGLYRMENGLYEEAVEAFMAYAEDETYGAGAWYNIGVCRMNMGDYAGAIEAFNTCADKGGNFTGLYYNRGICNLLSEKWEEGAADFASSLESEPYTADATYNLAICRMQMGNYEEAVAAFDELVSSVEGDGEATLNDAVYYFRAVSNSALGNLDAAVADLTICIDHGYELAQTYYQRALVYEALGDTEKQTSDLENSLKYAQ